jgi:PAS domain S-box-containing protein
MERHSGNCDDGGAAVSRVQQGWRIVWLVRALVTASLLILAITGGVIGSTLARLRSERVKAAAEQERLSRVSEGMRQDAAESRVQLQTVLDENSAATNRMQGVPRLVQLFAGQPGDARGGTDSTAARFSRLAGRLAEAARRSEDWRARYERIAADVGQQRTLGRVRSLVTRLRISIESLEGRRRLDEALRYRRWRAAKDDEANRLAQDILKARGAGQSRGANDFVAELAECARLVEVLGGEEQIDNLADLRANQLEPALDRLGRISTSFGLADSARPSTGLEFDELKAAIFGAGPDGGGLFALRQETLRLRREREKLKLDLAALFQDIDSANVSFALSTQDRVDALSHQMENSLVSVGRRMLYIGGGCTGLFLWLAWLISRGIHGQVKAIDQARAEAEAGRQTTHALMLEQQAAATALAAAHREIKASEHRLRMILETEPECVKLVSSTGLVIEMNPAGLRLLEADRADQVVGRPMLDFLPPEHMACFKALNEAVFRGEFQSAEFEIVGLKGTRRWMLTRACPLRDLEGSIISQLAVTSDITERKLAGEQLARARSFLNSVVENLPIGVFIKNAADRRIILWNRANEEIHGVSAVERLGKTDYDLAPKGEADYQTAKDTEILAQKAVVDIPMERIQTSGRGQRILHTRKLPIFDSEGRPSYLLGISEDITERIATEAALEKAHRDLLDVSRQAGMAEIATGVLHNVGNVLNSVNVSATLVSDRLKRTKTAGFAKVTALLGEQSSDLPGFFQRDARAAHLPGYLERFAQHLASEEKAMLGEVDDLRKNIEHIRDIVAMQQSYAKVGGLTESVNIPELIEDTLRMNASSLAKHEIELVREIDPALPSVELDKHKVLQILVNLLRNAKHACEASARHDKRIVVRAVVHEQRAVRMSVSDNGVGIPAENLDCIFNHGFTTKKEGHGFGLHSGANTAKEMGGQLTVESGGLGLGATFTLEVPLNRDAAKENTPNLGRLEKAICVARAA